jgi:hypothetical protein
MNFIRRFATTAPETPIARQSWNHVVQTAVLEHVECTGDEWKQVHFVSPALKYKIINQVLSNSTKIMNNMELTKIRCAKDLLSFENKPTKGIDDYVAKINAENVSYIPRPAPVVKKYNLDE